MKKIIAAFNGLDLSQGTLQYALYFSKINRCHLVGVFLDDFTRVSEGVRELSTYEGNLAVHLEEIRQRDAEARNEAVNRFEQQCSRKGIEYSVHRDKNIAIQDLLHESIYSDLLIIDSHFSFSSMREAAPTPFIRDLLAEVQCPALVCPHQYTPVDKIILLYDGEPSSVMAIKMFNYLFPDFPNVSSEVVTVKSEETSLHLPDNYLMKEFMKRHFPQAKYTVVKGDPEEEIVTYLKHQKPGAMVVLGAYFRSRVSRWFRHSMADVLMKHLKLPLFITHGL